MKFPGPVPSRIVHEPSHPELCKRLGVATRSHLAELPPGLSDLKIQEIAARAPAAWVKSRSKA